MPGRPRPGVRPTTAKVAEAVFQILEHALGGFEGKRVLDVCAGTGQFGLGLLERGAAEAVFVERSPAVGGELRARVRGLPASIALGSATAVLERLDGRFDVVFMDPPYSTSVASDCLEVLARRRMVAPGGVVAVEHHHKDPVGDAYGPLVRYRVQRYGETQVSFYAIEEGE